MVDLVEKVGTAIGRNIADRILEQHPDLADEIWPLPEHVVDEVARLLVKARQRQSGGGDG